MSSRINIKFVILLSVAVVVLGVAGWVAVDKFILKDAAQHAALGDEALAKGDAARAAGDFEVSNSFYDAAARQFNAAHRKDRSNTEYLDKSIVANESFVCTQSTEAQNRLEMIMSATKLIHDAPESTPEQRAAYYDFMLYRHRSGLTIEQSRPWLAYINRSTQTDLAANPENDLARKWRGVSGVYMLRNDMPDAERAVPREDIEHALEQEPDSTLLLHHLALWYYNEAERLKDAAGQVVTAAATAQYTLGLEITTRAYALDPNDPINAYNHLFLLYATPRDEEGTVVASIGQALMALGEAVATDPDTRATLTVPERSQVISWLGSYAALAGTEDTRASELALLIGQQAVEDHADHAESYQLLAQARLQREEFADAIDALNDGLATDRPLDPMSFMLDRRARLSLLSLLAETYTTQASQTPGDDPQRRALLAKAYETLTQFRAAEGAAELSYQARADYIAGRAAMVQNNPQVAIGFLEKANLFYASRDLRTLSLLARAHDANRNSGEAVKFYEMILRQQPAAEVERIRVVQLYIARGDPESLQLADRHITEFLGYNPEHMQARLIKANIFATAGRHAQAAEMVKQLDLEANPTLIAIYARYLSGSGEKAQALAAIRDRLAVEPNDQRALTVLFSLIDDKDQRLAALDTLEADGLNEATLRYYRAVVESDGQIPIEDLAELWEGQGNSTLQVNKQMLTVYAQTGNMEKLRETLAALIELAPNDKDVLTWRFNLAVNDKEWELADRVVRAMLQLTPTDRPTIAANDGAFLEAQVLAGRIMADTPEGEAPNLREAVRAYRRALDDANTFVPGWIALGKLYMVEQDWQRARDAFNRAYNIQDTNVEAATLLARTMVQTGEVDRALDLYREATRRQSNNRALLEEYLQIEASSGVRRLAMERREAMREAQPSDTANRRALAIMLAQDARYDEALAEIDAIETIDGRNLSTVTGLASVYALNDQPELGAQALRDYVDSRGDEASEQEYLALAGYLFQHGMPQEGETAIQQAIEREDPDTRIATRQWSLILAQSNRLTESARLLQGLIDEQPDDNELKTQLARVYLAMGNFDQAQATLGTVAASANKEVLRAQIQMQQGNFDAALALVRDARKDFEDSSALEVLEARLLSELGAGNLASGDEAAGRSQVEEALAIYERIVRRNASLYEYRVLMARLERLLGRNEQAVSRLVRIIDEDATMDAARTTLFTIYMEVAQGHSTNDPRRQQLASSAYTVLTPLLTSQPDNASVLRSAGQAAYEAGNYAAAGRHYESAFGVSDETSDLLGMVGSLLAGTQPREALLVLNKPEHADHVAASTPLRAMQAQALANSGQTDEARNLFTALLRRAGEPGEIAQVLGRLSQSQLKGEAGAIVDAAIPAERITPSINLQVALIALNQYDYPAVIERLSRYENDWEDTSRTMYQVHQSLALAYQQVGGQDNLLRARQNYEGMLEAFGENIEVLNNLAYLLTDQLTGANNSREAVRYAEKAIALIPEGTSDANKALLYDTLGWAQFKAEDLEAARATLRRSIELQPLAVNHMHMGQLYMAMGNKDLAISSLSQALSAARVTGDTERGREIQGYLDQVRNN